MQALAEDSVCSSVVNWLQSSILQGGNAAGKNFHRCVHPQTMGDVLQVFSVRLAQAASADAGGGSSFQRLGPSSPCLRTL